MAERKKFDEPFRSRDKAYGVIFLEMAFVLCLVYDHHGGICSHRESAIEIIRNIHLVPDP